MHLRALALQILGDAYSRVRKDDNGVEGSDADYVRIDTRTSRERERPPRS